MEILVCAELTNGVSFEMLQDNKVLVLNDGGLFVVTTKENSQHYKENFYSLDPELISQYGIVLTNNILRANYV